MESCDSNSVIRAVLYDSWFALLDTAELLDIVMGMVVQQLSWSVYVETFGCL